MKRQDVFMPNQKGWIAKNPAIRYRETFNAAYNYEKAKNGHAEWNDHQQATNRMPI
jgi:hypothetical protein